jgi:acetyl-CoA carboxylase biotin carboxyl carrier protein
MDDRLEGQGTGQAPERSNEGATPETEQRGAGRQPQQPPQGGARRDRDRERDPRRRRPGGGRESQPSQQQQPPQHSRRAEPSINMEELHELFRMFTAQSLTEFELEKEGFRVKLRRDLTAPGSTSAGGPAAAQPLSAVQPSAQVLPFVAPQITPGPAPEAAPAPAPAAAASKLAEEPAAAEQLHVITSPIVGTFYRAASPTSDPFVRQGSRVEQDTVVCIIEAMKLMNEILAESSGTVEEVYVENGQPVEYGQSLFGIRK